MKLFNPKLSTAIQQHRIMEENFIIALFLFCPFLNSVCQKETQFKDYQFFLFCPFLILCIKSNDSGDYQSFHVLVYFVLIHEALEQLFANILIYCKYSSSVVWMVLVTTVSFQQSLTSIHQGKKNKCGNHRGSGAGLRRLLTVFSTLYFLISVSHGRMRSYIYWLFIYLSIIFKFRFFQFISVSLLFAIVWPLNTGHIIQQKS